MKGTKMAKKGTKKKPATTAKRKPAAKKKAAAGDMLLVGSKVKAALKDSGCNVAGDALTGLNTWVYWLIEQAGNRAKENGRKTVRSHDFMSM